MRGHSAYPVAAPWMAALWPTPLPRPVRHAEESRPEGRGILFLMKMSP